MKTLKFLFILVSFIGLVGCDKKDNEEITNLTNLNVEKYIELLKSDQFVSYKIPAFTSNDIPSLLKYRNDNEIVTKFPANSISSHAMVDPKYKLGVLVLWTVESIRISSLKNSMNGNFPSQNPFIALRNNPSEWVLDYNNQAYSIISQAYFDWWENNKNKDFEQFKSIDPLINTNYIWH
jgi:hypothetical protein